MPSIITGGTLDITTNTGFAGARFSSGWLPVGISQVVVIIERVNVNNGQRSTSCLGLSLEELQGCYRFRTDPDLHGLGVEGEDLLFRVPVIAGVCFEIPDAAGDEHGPPFALHRREEVNGVLTGDAEMLDDVPAPFLRCGSFTPTGLSLREAYESGGLAAAARAGLFALGQGIASLVKPRALHAVDLGAGGSTNEFSRFGWARHATMTKTAGDGESAPAGTTIDASVAVRNDHHETQEAVAGQEVTFTVTGGNGTLVDGEDQTNTLTVTTNADGNATVSWRLGPGENTLEVATTHVTESPVFIHATGIALADFTVQDLSFAPVNPTSGSPLTVSAIITNAGGAVAAPATVNLCLVQFFEGGSGGSCFQPETPTLGPGESVTMSGTFEALLTGAYHVYASVDTFEVVPEAHEDNNSALGPEFLVTGPPLIDGNMQPGEWNGATTTEFDVNLPEGGTTKATLFVQNDATNLYLAVLYQRETADAAHLLNFEFDNNGNGLGPEPGDDYLTFTPTSGFSDSHRSLCGVLPVTCVTTDRTDGFAGFSIIQGTVVYEFAHPLNSGDVGNDFALTPPATIGVLLQLDVGTAHTRFPAGVFPTYQSISMTSP